MIELDRKNCTSYISQFYEFIKATSPISDSSWRALCDIMNFWKVEKNVCLLDCMKIENSVRFLGKGVVKCVDHHNGQSFVYDFRVAPIVLSETVSFMNGTPSCIALETLTACEFIELPREPFLALIEKNSDLAKFSILGVANYLGMSHYKEAMLRTLSAEQRYKQFLKEFPDVVLQVKLEDIASYVNITQPSLSRIRKNISWDKNEKQLEALSNELEVLNARKLN